jgi:hypothetical protein
MQPVLRRPGLGDDGLRCALLAPPQDVADEGMMPLGPGGFDEDAPQMGIAGFGDGATGAFGAAGMHGRDEPDKRHRARCRRKATRVAQFGGDGQRGELVPVKRRPCRSRNFDRR